MPTEVNTETIGADTPNPTPVPFEQLDYMFQAEVFRVESRNAVSAGQAHLDEAALYVSGKRIATQNVSAGVHFTFAQSYFMKANALATLANGVVASAAIIEGQAKDIRQDLGFNTVETPETQQADSSDSPPIPIRKPVRDTPREIS